jgi:hypothetical protein
MSEANPIGALEAALRVARAATHEHKLERPIAEALKAIIDVGHAAVDAFRAQERELGFVSRNVATLLHKESKRVHGDP